MMVVGLVIDSGSDPVSPEVTSLYIHDPWALQGFLGQNRLMSTRTWGDSYFTTVNSKHGHIIDTRVPTSASMNSTNSLHIATNQYEFGKYFSGSEVRKALMQYIKRNPSLKDRLDSLPVPLGRLNFGDAIAVESFDIAYPDYWIVPVMYGDTFIVGAIIFDQANGAFLEASWTLFGDGFIDKETARELVMLPKTKSISAKRVWRRSEMSQNPFHPYWRFEREYEPALWVSNQGEVFSESEF